MTRPMPRPQPPIHRHPHLAARAARAALIAAPLLLLGLQADAGTGTGMGIDPDSETNTKTSPNASPRTDIPTPQPRLIRFDAGGVSLGGELYLPEGPGPFPVVLYNHRSAPGAYASEAARAIGPRFAQAGWLFFMPHRHGQGLSADAGPDLGDELAAARRHGGAAEASALLAERLAHAHLDDQLAAWAWLTAQPQVDARRLLLAGNSFGGVEALLGATHLPACGVLAASAGAESWSRSPDLQGLMREAATQVAAPVFLFQPGNDADLEPQAELTRLRRDRGLPVEARVYPPFGNSASDGHRFAYAGVATWWADALGFAQKACAR